ncbi:6-pyruvoyltetrahydropterin/6-carboxytetrahydropterin synthase [Azospirillum fermentarium]|uniref:6-carboxytetrahydropterin synthase n=1 Tax=Azospirillum fermentarium TaxID=1233114 RepID=UPI00222728CA|nr:6-carboxytetrahydropterin synthase [Azospirillum fermentarium]MCW2246663.1 6-pyruvoyltetrahydropterin/6-carboxytetrahydropterin synthase [Azospirillum fermentarium]
MSFTVTRRIEIDAGHRIMTHGSKCRHMHGHRYAVEATAEAAAVHGSGEQTGMVVDFGFLKGAMVEVIDTPCDHGFIAAAADDDLLAMFAPGEAAAWTARVRDAVEAEGFLLTEDTRLATKLYVVPFQPTAECLARHWFERLAPLVLRRSGGLARLSALTVWETPNCRADYRP